jgi:hypothetical protein
MGFNEIGQNSSDAPYTTVWRSEACYPSAT